MLVSIIGWEAQGLRCPDNTVSFLKNGKVCKLNLVQMPNGSGKSTIIELISASMTGAITHWGTEKIRDFRSLDEIHNEGYFKLTMGVSVDDNDNYKEVVFELKFDFITPHIEIWTIKDATIGLEEGWKPPRDLSHFLNDQCVEVFVFKGDKVNKLVEKGNLDAENSIKSFFGLFEMDQIYHAIEESFSKTQSGIKTPQAQAKFNQDLNEWINWRDVLEKQREDIRSKLHEESKKFEDIKGTVEAIMNGQKESNQEKILLENSKEEAKQLLLEATKEAFEELRNPFFISDRISKRMESLNQNLDTLKLPGTSGEFFIELSKEKDCVCGRYIDEEAEKNILEKSISFLSDNHISVINGIKRDIKDRIEITNNNKKRNKFILLEKASNDYSLADSRLKQKEELMKDVASIQDKNVLAEYDKVKAEKDKLEMRLIHIESSSGDYRTYERQGPRRCKKIPIVEKIINKKQEELASINDTVEEFKAKETLKRIISLASENALKDIKAELKSQSNIKLQEILPEGTPLSILKVDKHIQLGFGDMKQKLGSGGQNVSVAYSFATSILERSGAQFPLIVDHPVTALQESSRRRLGEKLGKICHQFIGFIIDTEKIGFVESLSRTGVEIVYITLFRDIQGNKVYIDKLPDDRLLFSRSRNGLVCNDEVFFNEFKDISVPAKH